MNIYLIEPDARRSAQLQRLLRSLGHITGETAELADVCILSDAAMEQIPQLPVPCIVVSEQGTTSVAATAFEQGAVDFLRYPVFASSLSRSLAQQPTRTVSPTVAHSFPLPTNTSRDRRRSGRMESVLGIDTLLGGGFEKIFNVQKPHSGAGKACRVQVPGPVVQVIRALTSVWGDADKIALLKQALFWEALCGEVLLTWLWERERLPKERVIVMADVSPELYRWMEAVLRGRNSKSA